MEKITHTGAHKSTLKGKKGDQTGFHLDKPSIHKDSIKSFS